MASKPKRDGKSALKVIVEAIKQCDTSIELFFHRATLDSVVPSSFNVRAEAARFIHFLKHGPTGKRKYWIPEHVLAFAKKILAHASPRSFFRSMRVSYYRATAGAGA